MPDTVTFLSLGGNHTDDEWASNIGALVQELHRSGVPLTLAIENITVAAEKMVKHKAQLLAEMRLEEKPSLSPLSESGEDAVRRIAKEYYGVELGEFESLLQDGMLGRIECYEQELELYKFAGANGIEVKGLESEQSRANVDFVNVHDHEAQRLQGMANKALGLMQEQMQKGGGVVITVDLGQGHCATLSRALAAKVAEKAQEDVAWNNVKVANFYSPRQDSKVSMFAGAANLEKSAHLAENEQAFYEQLGKVTTYQLSEQEVQQAGRDLEKYVPEVALLEQQHNELKNQSTSLEQQLKGLAQRNAELDSLLDEDLSTEDQGKAMIEFRSVQKEIRGLEAQIKAIKEKLKGDEGILSKSDAAKRKVKDAKEAIEFHEKLEVPHDLANHQACQQQHMLTDQELQPRELLKQAGLLKDLHMEVKQELPQPEVVAPENVKDALKPKEVDPEVAARRLEKRKSLHLPTPQTSVPAPGHKRSHSAGGGQSGGFN